MAGVRVDKMPPPFNVPGTTPIPPFYEVFGAHWAVGIKGRDIFYNQVATNPGEYQDGTPFRRIDCGEGRVGGWMRRAS